jgi:glycine/D-amino acid oxidase-like deaminating enzyme
MTQSSSEVTVIGAGVIGLSAALALQERGCQVRVLDREGVAAGASRGNAGGFAFSEIVPLSTPGVMRKAPGWLLDPLGPLSVPPAYALQIAPWMLRFWRASWKDRYHASMSAQAALMALSRDMLMARIKDIGAEDMLRREGQLVLYEGRAEFEASLPGWEVRADHDIAFSLLSSPEEIATIQPGISPQFDHGAFTPGWYNISDPALWVERLAQEFCARGGEIGIANVTGLQQQGEQVILRSDGADILTGRAVICAGAWSHQLARSLGHRIPLEAERGYNTTLPAGAFDLKTLLTFSGHGFVVSRIGDGIRVGGAVEFGGLKLPPNYQRARTLLTKAKKFLPALKTGGGTEWMGCRPSMPDSLPVIGTVAGNDRITYAFGHGHLGLTQSAGTARLVADLISGATPAIDLHPFRQERY